MLTSQTCKNCKSKVVCQYRPNTFYAVQPNIRGTEIKEFEKELNEVTARYCMYYEDNSQK